MKYVLIIMVLALFSCEAQKDIRAVKRVKANIDLLDEVFVAGLKLHPCANDTVIKTKTDTTTVINDVITVKNDTIFKERTKTITLRDTVKITVTDTQKQGILNDTIKVQREVVIRQSTIIEERDKTIKQKNKKITKLWIVIGAMIALGLGYGYVKIKKII